MQFRCNCDRVCFTIMSVDFECIAALQCLLFKSVKIYAKATKYHRCPQHMYFLFSPSTSL